MLSLLELIEMLEARLGRKMTAALGRLAAGRPAGLRQRHPQARDGSGLDAGDQRRGGSRAAHGLGRPEPPRLLRESKRDCRHRFSALRSLSPETP